jgi:hypothetical protein
MIKRKFIVGTVCGVFAVIFVLFFLYKEINVTSSSYKWESFDVPDEWHYCEKISLDSGIPFIQIDKLPTSLSISIQNNSSNDIEFLCESISLQKMDESAQWLTWSSLTESDEVGAEIQKFLLPGDSLKYNAKLSDLIPAELLTVGNYRLFLPFTYRSSESNDTIRPIEVSYGYTVSEIKIQ